MEFGICLLSPTVALTRFSKLPVLVFDGVSLFKYQNSQVLEEIARVAIAPGERLQAETQNLLQENARLRKQLNDYAEGLLDATMKKVSDRFDVAKKKKHQPTQVDAFDAGHFKQNAPAQIAKQPPTYNRVGGEKAPSAYVGGSTGRGCGDRLFMW